MTDTHLAVGSAFWPNLWLNILGGFLAAIAFWLIGLGLVAFGRRVIKRRAGLLFGDDALDGKLHLVFAEWELREECLDPDTSKNSTYPYRKPGEATYIMKVGRVVPLPDTRCISYLARTLSQVSGKSAPVASDKSVRASVDLSFVSFGLGSNYKTRDLLQNPANRRFAFDFDKGKLLIDGQQPERKGGFDYGVIAKVRPQQFPKRVWIACAGLGEWGTSGAAWFLANKWAELYEAAHDEPFVALVRVSPEQDESPELLQIWVGTEPKQPSTSESV